MTSPRKIVDTVIRTRSFMLPKSGHSLFECEDAVGVNPTVNRYAVADGATEAFDAGNWARRLARNWVQADGRLTAAEFWSWLESEGQRHTDSWNGADLSWYAEEKARSGSFAAFVGVQLELAPNSIGWKAVALGDSCLLQLRAGLVIKSLPVLDSASFGFAPVLAPTNTSLQSSAMTEIVVDSGELNRGDALLLVSDAVAAWYLSLAEQKNDEKQSQFESLLNRDGDSHLEEFFARERETGKIKDDDVAIVRIEV
jgi:hypothetical protein